VKEFLILAKYNETYVKVHGDSFTNESEARNAAYALANNDTIDMEYSPDSYHVIEKSELPKYVELH
jgi:hypothetical protein